MSIDDHTRMSQQELLEHALLDALALLDEDEHEAFNEAFASAPPHVQAQVRREQTRLVRIEALLPEVTPPASLRAKVLGTVRDAMARGESGDALPALTLNDADEIASLPEVAHRRRVAAVWRAMALGCAAAAVFLGMLSVHLQGLLHEFSSQDDLLMAAIREEFGPDYLVDALVDEDTHRIAMTAADFDSDAGAAVWTNPRWRTAKLFGINLPDTAGSQYRLVVLDEAGEPVSVVAEFTFNGGLLNREVPVTVSLDAERLAIVSGSQDETDSVLLAVPEVFEH